MSLPIVEHQGRRWRFNEDLYPERFNWKSVFVGRGAEMDALDIDANLVSRYPFDDTFNDSVGTNNLSGSMTYGSGVYGRAIAPSSQRAQASAQTVHEFGTSDFAFSFWLRLNAISDTQVIIGKRDPAISTNKGYRIYVNSSGKLVAEYCDGTACVISATSSFTISANTWYFIKVSFDRDGFLSIYYNEVGDASVSIGAQQGSISTNGQTFTVASDSPSGTNYLNGRLDQLQVFSGTVSDTSAQEIFGNRHAMQLLGCMETGSGFTKGYLYVVNEENTGTVRIQRSAGDVELDGSSKVLGFVEKPRIPDGWINAGVYRFTQEIFDYLPESGNIEVTALPALAKEGKLDATKYENVFWRSIDSHKDIQEAAREISGVPVHSKR